ADVSLSNIDADGEEKIKEVAETEAIKTDLTSVKADLRVLGEDEKSLYEDIVGKNLVNVNTMVVGAIDSDGTILTNGAWNGYRTSEFIKVKANATYTFSRWVNGYLHTASRMLYLLFDENKTPIISSHHNQDNIQFFTVTPTIDGFIRISDRQSASQKPMFEIGSTYTDYVDYELKRYSTLYVNEEKLPLSDSLYGKKWVVFGDSFTNGATPTIITEGKYKGRPYTYPYLIGNRLNMDIIRFFEGGRTLAYPANPGSFINSATCPNQPYFYQNIPEDADYITFYLGINDESHYLNNSQYGEDTEGYIGIGSINDETTATYYGAWNVILYWLRENRPFAHIGMIITNGISVPEFREAQQNIAKKHGIPFIDLNGDDRTPCMIRSINPDIQSFVRNQISIKQRVSSSNTHPNDNAHLYESQFIENFLRSL
ncbi:MAG: SGNH/GDSL hydrolase family protein, partial [Bacteroidales bacterium]|nr:SGNH/GDSL hydrolase family protein [Candidatus Scybalousia scybalohippi]